MFVVMVLSDASGPPEENRLHPPGVDVMDGHYSLGAELLLFGDGVSRPPSSSSSSSSPTSSSAVTKEAAAGAAAAGGGGGVRAVVLHTRCLHAAEVTEFTSALRRESQAGVVQQITEHLMAMGVDGQIAHWAATQSEGASVDQRINSALNMVYS